MKSLGKFTFAAALALGAAGSQARADHAPFSNNPRYPTFGSLFQGHHKAPLPTFQAAPWYLYWPYDGHFQTPAPVTAPFYAPPGPGNFPVNPYFPAPAGPYGPIPGGPAPGIVSPYGVGSYPPGGFGPGAMPSAPAVSVPGAMPAAPGGFTPAGR